LFIGNECEHWTPQQFADAGRFARSIGCDTIAPKRANGNQKWYVSPAQLQMERAAVLAVGCGYLPFMYCYGPAFGSEQIHIEAATLREMMAVCDGMACADMESEWNGKVAEAELFASLMAGHGGILTVSTWADPREQNWMGVLDALRPVVDVWGPQQYTNWLEGRAGELAGESCIQPEFDLSPSFGPDNVLQLVADAKQRGELSIWLWEYQYAQSNPVLVHQISSLFGSSSPVPPPAPPPVGWQSYVVQAGDSLGEIAAFLKLGSWFSDLYQPNMGEIEATARQHGQPNSEMGHWIYPNEVLKYRR
jgi:hypothetical protein